MRQKPSYQGVGYPNGSESMKTMEEQNRDRFIALQDTEVSLAESPEFTTLVCSFGSLPMSMRKDALLEIAKFSVSFVERRMRNGI